jgi:hypothetical protein
VLIAAVVIVAVSSPPAKGLCSDTQTLEYVLQVMTRAWQVKDGAAGIRVHSAIVELMIIRPQETIQWLTDQPEIFSELMEKMQFDVFTDYSGQRSIQLNSLRDDLIEVLEQNRFDEEQVNVTNRKILDRVKSISVRKID